MKKIVLGIACVTGIIIYILFPDFGNIRAEKLSKEALIGAAAFNDPSLSESGQLSCASCHAADTGHAAPNGLAVQPGGPRMELQGLRASQSLRYLAGNSAFHFDKDGKAEGGFFWDGRANSLAEQAQGPLLNEREMANKDKAAVVAKISRASWVADFKRIYGGDVLQNPDLAFSKLTQALQKFQLEDAAFNAYTSKFDAYLRGQTSLSEQEARGLALFNDAKKGNCNACHSSEKNSDGSHPIFTDFSYDNLGVPRNPEIAANADLKYFDLGLCSRPDLQTRTDLCGMFRVPSLRNVALRKAFFHNGKFKTLKESLAFYVQRDTQPEKWYPRRSNGSINKFDDLPAKYMTNVNSKEVPYDRSVGEQAALSDAEIDDVLAFLKTLNDNWKND